MGRTPLSSTRGRGRGTPATGSRNPKLMRTPEKSRAAKAPQHQEASTSRKRQIPRLVTAARAAPESTRVKQNTPLQKPKQGASADPRASQKVGPRTGLKALVGKNPGLDRDATEQCEETENAEPSIPKLHRGERSDNVFTQQIRQSPRKKAMAGVKDPVPMTHVREPSFPKPQSHERNKPVLFPEIRKSPRKKPITAVKATVVESAAKKIGRRTGEAAFAGKTIRVLPDGMDNFNDYWTDPESSSRASTSKEKGASHNESVSGVPKKRQSPRKKMTPVKDMRKANISAKYAPAKVGPRTGDAAFKGKNIRRLPDGTENFKDYWTEDESSDASSVTAPSLVVSSLDNSADSERVMFDKACSTSKNIDASSFGDKNETNTSMEHSHFSERTSKVSEKENRHDLSQNILSSINESSNRSNTSKINRKLFQNNTSEVENENIETVTTNAKKYSLRNISQNEEPSHQYSQNTPSKHSPSRSLSRSKTAKSKELQDVETHDESKIMEPEGFVSSATKRKNTTLRGSSKLIDDTDNEQNIVNAPASAVSKSTAKRSLNFSASSVSRNKEDPKFSKQSIKLTEYSFSEDNDSNNERTSSTFKSKKSTLSPRKSLLRKTFDISKSSRNESMVNKDLENEVESSKKNENRSVSFSFPNDKVSGSFASLKHKGTLIEDSVSEDSDNGTPSTSIKITGDGSSRNSQKKSSKNVSQFSRNKSNITEEVENNVKLDKVQEKKPASFRKENERKDQKVRKISQSKGPKSMVIEDTVSEDDSDNVPDNEAPLTTSKSTVELSSRSPSRKSQNVSRSNDYIAEEIQKLDKRQEEKAVSRTNSGEVAKKVRKISQSKGPKSMLVEDSVSEDDSDNVPDNDAPLTRSKSTVELSSRSPSRKSQNVSRSNDYIAEEIQKLDKRQEEKAVSRTNSGEVAKKVRKISQSRGPKSMLVEDSVSEDSDNDAPLTRFGNTVDVSSRSLSRQSQNVSRSTGNINEIENGEEFENNQENQSHSFRTEKKKLSKSVSQSKGANSIRSLKLQATLESIREEDSENEAHSTSIRSEVKSRSSPKKSHNVSRPTRNVTEEIENDVELDIMKQKTSVRTGSEKTAKKIKVSKSEKPKSKLIEDSESEYSDNVPDNDAPSTSFRNTGDRSSPRKKHNVSRSTTNKPHADKKKEKTAVSFETDSENTASKVRKNSLRMKTNSVATKPKSTLIEDSVSEGDSDNDAHSTNVKSTGKQSLRTSPRKATTGQRKLIEDAVSENTPENINANYDENASISRRFSPRKNSSKKYHSTPKSPMKRNQLTEDKHSIAKENAFRSRGVSDASYNLGDAGSSGHGSRIISDQLIEEEFQVDKDSGVSSAKNASKRGSRRDPTSGISQNKEDDSQKLSPRKNLTSSRKKSKLIEDVEDESADESEIASIRTRISQPKGSRVSRTKTRNSKLLEDIAGGSADEFEEVGIDSGNGNEVATRYSGDEFGDDGISPVRDEVGASGAIISPKRKSRAVENDTEDLTQENELEENESVPAPKGKKTKNKKVRPSVDPSQDIVPAPKGKKSKKRVDPIPTEPKRRSQRKHVPPLDFWRGERVKSKYVDGEIVTIVTSGRKYDDGASAVLMRRLGSKVNKLKKLEKVKKGTIPKTTVYDHHKDELVDVNLHRPFMMSQWTAVGGEGGKKVPYYLTKTFSSEKVTFGFLDICALEVKTSQYSPEDNIHFVIQKGVVKVTIRRTTYEFQKYDSFIVPCSEAYAIENLGKSNALLSFCTFKVPFFPYQMVDEEDDEEEDA